MYRAKLLYCIGLLLAVWSAKVYGEGDSAVGEEIARQRCAHCHNVEPKGPFKQYPPSFAAIAVYRSEKQIFAQIVVPPLHSAMPHISYMLTRDNVKHLVAYIRSLESDQLSE